MALSRREREVAELVALGLTNRAIAQRLFLSERTVEGHIDRAFSKLGLSSRTQLAMWVGATANRERSAVPAHSSFPTHLTSFVGRQNDVASLKVMLTERRLVTLIGAGGSGKTRLALELARVIAGEGTAVWLVDISMTSDPALVPQVIASAVGAGGPSSPTDAVIECLKDSKGLLVVDNCEQVAEAMSGLAARIAAECPGIALLMTSREPIRVEGETTWRVEPLAVPPKDASPNDATGFEAVRLFEDRARLAAPGFKVDDSNAGAVAEVCRRLDGLPLAVELAAARVAVLSPAQIVRRLDDRFTLLVSGSRSTVARHQALKTTLEWSYGLLPPTERRLFGRLSVFAGSFNVDAVEAVAGVEPLERGQLLELLGLLIDKSLVAVTAETRGELRYRLLDSMRAFGGEMLSAESDASAIVERHARLYSSIALEAGKRLGGADAPDWVSLVMEEVDNLRSALEWTIANDIPLALQVCASLAGYWDLHGWIYEGRHWLSRALHHDVGGSSPQRGAALAAAGLLAYRQSDYAEATTRFEEARRVADAIGDRSMLARALAGLGDIHIVLSQPNEALRYFQQSLELYRAANDLPSIARGLSRLGNAYDNLFDYEAEEAAYRESLTLFRQLDDRIGIADQLFSIGMCRMISGKFESALPFAAESIAIRKQLGDVLGIAYSRMVVGICETRLGRPLAATGPLSEALAGMEDAGDGRGVGLALDASVGPLLMVGKPDVALRLASAAAHLRTAVGYAQPPFFQPIVDGWAKEARRRLSASGAATEEVFGQGLSRQAAVRLAIEQLLTCMVEEAPRQTTGLTARELQVTALVADGLTNREIGARLRISERTVDSHVQHAIAKLGFRSRAQIAAWHASTRQPADRPEKGIETRSKGRHVTTILVVDLVDSTAKVTQLGDSRWRALLHDHYKFARRELERHNGIEVDTAGDGLLATFDGPATAIKCAWAIQLADRALGLASRAGVHCGEVEHAGPAIRGIAVHFAARLAGLGDADEVLVSSTTRDLAAGSDIRFENRGKRRLKGIADSRSVFAALRVSS
jgi:non-specific serine/threonine protein kinase